MSGPDGKPTLLDRPMPSSFDENNEFYDERVLHKVFRKLREEPLIPLGCGLTVFAFVSAWRAIRRGDSAQANKMFRARVAAQGFTVLAMLAGSMYYNKDRERTAELRKIKEAKDAEEKRQRWIRELEARDDEEKALRAMLQNKRAKFEAAKSGAAGSETPADGEKPKSGGVLGTLGLSGWGKPEAESAASPAPSADQTHKKENPKSSLSTIGEIYGRKPSSSGESSEEPKK
ncbi:hypoxia induced protein conserved region-domain-containing protein [Colletotrichum navitas]|uniref:Hypoxia induced protein conserved region-domain-containing protein n=1 Tax=Colletotrichum navitas TaxID=681940 RepID=A0AAD8PS29_9PEZI|nr:hypoxia induced protein conserved region-domain-containing protein [Colletotrichum navitas]KAK1579694.1 hypoxia induced protein conserved region-domain-containing protein [Colletotrichum navitas]